MEFLYQWQARELYRLLVYQHLCSDYIDFIDHNCRPSAYVRVDGDNIVLKAIEKIASEADEITIDYNCSGILLRRVSSVDAVILQTAFVGTDT